MQCIQVQPASESHYADDSFAITNRRRLSVDRSLIAVGRLHIAHRIVPANRRISPLDTGLFDCNRPRKPIRAALPGFMCSPGLSKAHFTESSRSCSPKGLQWSGGSVERCQRASVCFVTRRQLDGPRLVFGPNRTSRSIPLRPSLRCSDNVHTLPVIC